VDKVLGVTNGPVLWRDGSRSMGPISYEDFPIVSYLNKYTRELIKVVYADGSDWLIEEMNAVRRWHCRPSLFRAD